MMAVMELLRDHLCSSSWWRQGCAAAPAGAALLRLLASDALPAWLLQALGLLGQGLLGALLLVAVLAAEVPAAVASLGRGGEQATSGSVPESLHLAGSRCCRSPGDVILESLMRMGGKCSGGAGAIEGADAAADNNP
jgi:hypothetical protein